MICGALSTIGPAFDWSNLVLGSLFDETLLKTRPGFGLPGTTRHWIAVGKDAAITHLLDGGNGYPPNHSADALASATIDAGMTAERRDFRSLKIWMVSLAECQRDASIGRKS